MYKLDKKQLWVILERVNEIKCDEQETNTGFEHSDKPEDILVESILRVIVTSATGPDSDGLFGFDPEVLSAVVAEIRKSWMEKTGDIHSAVARIGLIMKKGGVSDVTKRLALVRVILGVPMHEVASDILNACWSEGYCLDPGKPRYMFSSAFLAALNDRLPELNKRVDVSLITSILAHSSVMELERFGHRASTDIYFQAPIDVSMSVLRLGILTPMADMRLEEGSGHEANTPESRIELGVAASEAINTMAKISGLCPMLVAKLLWKLERTESLNSQLSLSA